MKKINYIIIVIMLLFSANLLGQTSYLLTFQGMKKDSSNFVTLDSVYIKNETSGEAITITDTFLYLNLSTSISEKSRNDNTFSIYQNYMNVDGNRSSFIVQLPNNSNLVITSYDITGKELCHYQGNLGNGIHTFGIEFGIDGIYIISATNGEEIKTFKTFRNGNGNANNGRITLIGSVHNSIDPVKKTRGGIFFTLGDQLMYIGYSADSNNGTINDSPTGDNDYIFMMEKYIACGTSINDDRDGNTYKTVQIGSQCWMAENLAYLLSVSPSNVGSNAESYYYVNDYQGTSVSAAKAASNFQTYGVLYNWLAAMNGENSSNNNPSGVQGICPAGWHLPSDAEWTELTNYLGGESVAGGKMKEAGTSHWNNPNSGATNSSGFTALPGGYRTLNGYFDPVSLNGLWWSSTEYSTTNAWNRFVPYYLSGLNRENSDKGYGYSIRCVRD